MIRWIAALLEYEPTALDSLYAYLSTREAAASTRLMGDDGPALYRAQGAFAELQTLRVAVKNALGELTRPSNERTPV